MIAAFEELKYFLGTSSSVIIGDFNQTVTMDNGKVPGRKFSTVLEALDRLGLKSAWHLAHSEKQGEESAASFYWTWNQAKPFHIDFAFGSDELGVKMASLGSYKQYVEGRISDHVPLVIDYELQEAR